MKLASTCLLFASSTAFSPANVKSRQASSLNLAVGETAPDFSLVDQNDKIVTRSSIKKPLVVFFYPADSTPGCTIQATTFNEQIKDIRGKYGAQVVGISGQDIESKQKFAEELGLQYSILVDENDSVRKSFNVPRAAFGLFPGRVTYVLDKNGICVKIHDDLGDAASHVAVAEEALAELAPAKGPNPFSSIFS